MLLHVLEAGAGPPVALLHGLFGRAQNLGSLARRLSSGFRVLSIDLRNHGASPHAPGMGYAWTAADVVETLADLGALPATVVGHSMGGKVAMMMALLRPGAVDSLIVADIAPVAYAHRNAEIAAAMLALELEPGLSRVEAGRRLAAAVSDEGTRIFLLQNLTVGRSPAWRIGLREIAEGMPDIEGWPDLPDGLTYTKPTLFLRGGASDYVRPCAHEAIAARFPLATIETLEGAGHWLHADQPDAFAGAVEAFLKQRTRLP